VDTDCNLHNDKEPIKVWVPWTIDITFPLGFGI
jgi:hypothetical protein